ncbi:hypothetical protein ACHAXT_011611 [Thalassiosira profunda]
MMIILPNRRCISRCILTALLFAVVTNGDRYCGVDQDEAEAACWQPCNTDNDCCSSSQRCYEAGSSCPSSDLSGFHHNFCGVSWCDAAYSCNTPCPNTDECPAGQYCYADVPCDSDSPRTPPTLPGPDPSAPFQFCGGSMSDARDACWQPCPQGDSDCCLGLNCFDTSQSSQGTCSSSDYSGTQHFYCGASWCGAAYSCQSACPGGTNEECPAGQYCYADVPCSATSGAPPIVQPPPSIFNQYCGDTAEDAADQCWQPCRGNEDCCFGQTCFSTVGTSCSYPDTVGPDHYFCGSDFCDASFSCHQPCPTGFDAECPSGMRCFANTPCNANLRSMSANFLDYGLPLRALELAQTTGQTGQTNAAPGSEASLGFLCLISLIAAEKSFG